MTCEEIAEARGYEQLAWDMVRKKEKEITALRAEIHRKDEALSFLASVIKSEEPWAEDCEEMLRKALSTEDDSNGQEPT